MNKDLSRQKISKYIGKQVKFIYNGSRNQREKFKGTIISVFPSIFLVETNDSIKRIKSFSYNDVISSNLQIIEK
ncbi:MAG: Veg family protein [Bacilli bacterium]|nr:Veg family protein [Bacilli bacterium]